MGMTCAQDFRMCWNPKTASEILVIEDAQIHLLDVEKQAARCDRMSLPGKGNPKLSKVVWNPHSVSEFGSVNDTALRLWDQRTQK